MPPDSTPTPKSVPADPAAAEALALAQQAAGGVAFAALSSEPNTGVGVISARGKVMYLNAQAAAIFHGSGANASDYVGRLWQDYMPADWTRERLRVLAAVGVSGRPVLMRTIWRDHQQLTWIYPIERPTADETEEHHASADDLFLTITRRVTGDDDAERLMPASDQIEEIESGVMRLRALDALSSRELQVLALLGQGLSMGEAAGVLRLSEKTVDNHRTAIHQKLNVHDRPTLVKIAARAGLSLSDAERKRV
jgi:DNA-binding NarL/FixJ family response regulator